MMQLTQKPLMVGVIGATASGKTSICSIIEKELNIDCALISLDNFYKGLGEEDHNDADNYDFDHPNALDMDLALIKL
jgi:uridine kinase